MEDVRTFVQSPEAGVFAAQLRKLEEEQQVAEDAA